MQRESDWQKEMARNKRRTNSHLDGVHAMGASGCVDHNRERREAIIEATRGEPVNQTVCQLLARSAINAKHNSAICHKADERQQLQ